MSFDNLNPAQLLLLYNILRELGEGHLPAAAIQASNIDIRKKADKRILIIFFAFAILSLVLPIALSPLFKGATVTDILSRIFGGLTLSLFLAGFSSYFSYRKSGLTPRRKLLRWFFVISVAASIVLSAVAAIAIWYDPAVTDVNSTPAEPLLPLIIVIVFVSLIPTLFLSLLSLMVLGFGIVGVMAAVERRLTPYILKVIAGSSGKPKHTIAEIAVRWLFDLPDVLDARSLRLDPDPPRTKVLPGDMRWPVGWQLFFGAILAVYVSFNPFLANRSPEDLLSIFSLLTSASVVIPFLILSWFIYLRVGARLHGQVKDFTLFKGIRARLFQSYFAVGTLIVLVRLSISKIEIGAFVSGFSLFMLTLLSIAIISSFVYMNNFENGLTEDIVSEFQGKEDATSSD